MPRLQSACYLLLMRNHEPVPLFFLALGIAATGLLVFVMFPLISELLLAAMLASTLWPLQQWLSRRLRGHRAVAAVLLTIAVVVLLLGPMATLVTFLIRDGSDALRFMSKTMSSEVAAEHMSWVPRNVRETVTEAFSSLPSNLEEALALAGAYREEAVAAVAATGSILFHGTLMLIAFLFLLIRGNELVDWLVSRSPLGRDQTRELLTTFKKVSFAAIVAATVTAAAQAIAALIGFYIARVPGPIFFAVVTFFLAFIPSIGAAAGTLIAALLLVATGHPYMAMFLSLWGILVVGIVDNLIKPLLVRRGMEIHGVIVFFSLLGGLAAFGPIGLLVGPLVVSFFLAVVRIYHRDFAPASERVVLLPEPPPIHDATTADTERPGDVTRP